MFNDSLKLHEGAACNVSRKRDITDDLPLRGKWVTEHWKRKKSGTLYLHDTYVINNLITTLAKNKLFDTMFNAATQQLAADFCGSLINAAGFTAYNIADTMASHTGWVEWTSYSQATRVAWGQGAAAAAAITNASPMTFDINAPGTIQGLFITTVATKGGTTGLLWSAASYTSPVAVVSADQIRSTYSLSA